MQRRIKIVKYTKPFLKKLSRLSERLITQAQKKEILFKRNPFSPQLTTHKLSGRDKDSWAFSVNHACRIKFLFITDEEVLFLDIGTHKIYK